MKKTTYFLWVKLQNNWRALVENQQGVTAVEYAIIAVAMSAIVLSVYKDGAFSNAINGAFTQISTNINSIGNVGK